MKKTNILFSMILVVALLFAQTIPIAAKEATVSFDKTKVSIYIGGRTTLSLKQKTNKTLLWSTSNERIAKVSKKGSVSAIKAGSATITATLKGTKQKATCKVKVGEFATKLSLASAGTVILDEGKTSQINASVAPAKVLTNLIQFSSKDSSIATVDKNGLITAVSEGMTQITLTTKALNKDGNTLKKDIQVVVNKSKEDQTTTGGSTGGTGGTVMTALVNTVTSGNTSTYVLNKSYTSNVTVSMSVNGQSWSYAGKVATILDDLNTTYTTKTNAANTICATRNMGEEWWTVTDPSNGNALLFKVKADMTSGGNASYGQIVIEQASGTVSVSVQ